MENEQNGKRVHSSETESLSSSDDGLFVDETPHQQITNNDLESLHEKVCLNHICLMPCQPNRSLTERLLYAISYQVVNLLSRCTCPVQFYLEHLSEGKYRIGDTRTLIFVRVCFNIYSFDLLSIIQPSFFFFYIFYAITLWFVSVVDGKYHVTCNSYARAIYGRLLQIRISNWKNVLAKLVPFTGIHWNTTLKSMIRVDAVLDIVITQTDHELH